MKRAEQISIHEETVEAVEQGLYKLRSALNKSLQDARGLQEDYDRLMAQHDRLLDEHRALQAEYANLGRAFDDCTAGDMVPIEE